MSAVRGFGAALLGVAIVVTVSGCATHAQQQAQAIAANNQSAMQQLRSCHETIYNSPEYALLRPHVPMNLGDATLEQMADSSYATNPEISAIIAVHPEDRACASTFLNQIAQETPSVAPIFSAFLNKSEDATLDLIQKKISWGDFVRRKRDMIPEFQSELAAEYQRIRSGLYQENQAELAQRQAAANAFTQWAQTQEIIDSLNRPVVTNCLQSGNSINCISQ